MARLSTRPGKRSLVLDYLSGRFTYLSRDAWLVEILAGNIRIGEETVTPDTMVEPGEELVFFVADHLVQEPPVDPNWSLIREDPWLFVVNKPGDLPVHPAGRYKKNSLVSILEEEYPDTRFLPCHRLDRETSGILVFAKDSRTGQGIARQFQERTVKKQYSVWVYGEFPLTYRAEGEIISDELSAIRKKKKFREVVEPEQATAVTEFTRVSYRNGISYLHAKPVTGKIHQIRATLYSLGYPVVGDKIYGKNESVFLEFIARGWSEVLEREVGHYRQALHCHSLSLIHPITGERWDISSQVPADLQKFL